MSAKIRCPTLLLVALCFVLQVFAIRFPLPPGSEKCFTEDLNVGTKCLLNYHFESAPEVFSFLMLFDPAGSQIFMRENPENGHYQFTTSLAGPYKICARSEKDDEADFLIHAQRLDADGKPLDDQGERIQFAGKKKQEDGDDDYDEDDDSTLVKIELLTGMQAQPESKTLKESSLKPLEIDIQSIELLLSEITSNLVEMKNSESSLRDHNESLNSKALWFSVLSSVIIISVGAYQVIHLKNFLMHKKVI